MSIHLFPIIQRYTDASNAHDVKAILECFADDAVVRDENATHRGKIDIRHWTTTTIGSMKVVTCAVFAMRPPSNFLRQQRQRNSGDVAVPCFQPCF